MVLELLLGLVIIAIIAFVAIRVVGSITLGIVLISIVLIASHFLIGTFPNLKNIPLLGQFFTFIPSTTGGFVAVINEAFFRIDIQSTSRDSENNLFIAVENTGAFDVTEFKVIVDNKTASITNKPKDPLKPKEVTTIETDWKDSFTSILVETKQAKAAYKL